jgi:hypothetical protein
MKQNEQQKSKIRNQKDENAINNQQSPQILKTFVLPHLCNFHKCRGHGAKYENQSSATLTQRRLQSSRTTYLSCSSLGFIFTHAPLNFLIHPINFH